VNLLPLNTLAIVITGTIDKSRAHMFKDILKLKKTSEFINNTQNTDVRPSDASVRLECAWPMNGNGCVILLPKAI
jgi:hypothetical protein